MNLQIQQMQEISLSNEWLSSTHDDLVKCS
jgi:hypothetical protein